MRWLIDALIRARNSTIKRIKDLTEDQLDLHSADKVSIRDIAWHIAKCDNAAIKPFKSDLEFDDRIYPVNPEQRHNHRLNLKMPDFHPWKAIPVL